MRFADRVTRVEPSATLAVSNLASELEADGVDVVDLSVGEPDFDTPENVTQAGKDALDAGKTKYAPSNGIPGLREEIASKLRGDGLEYEAGNVVVTPGAKQALFESFQALVEEGSGVVLLDPAWVSYEAIAKMAGADLSRVDLAPHDFQLEPALDDLADAVSDDTALLVVNSPSNPTGAVYSRAAMEGVRDLAVEHDFSVISDEIYQHINYGPEHVSLAGLDGMRERTVTVNGFSKAYSMTGWRLGYLAAPEDVVAQVGKVQSHSVSSAATFVQHAGVEALANTDDAVDEMVAAFEERRDFLLELFAEHGLDLPTPEGAFYLMIPVREAQSASERASSAERNSADSRAAEPRDDGDQPRADDQQWCQDALKEANVATVPGSAFGAPGYARLSYAASKERLEEGVERLADAGFL